MIIKQIIYQLDKTKYNLNIVDKSWNCLFLFDPYNILIIIYYQC